MTRNWPASSSSAAGLNPAGADNPDPLDALPLEENATFLWQ